ncbi:ribose-5-phosphate isomerase [Pontibacter ummariensis]|uniref:Ribose-5-phosphate isomerase A n=1 Tax=Pontibacter ummariensis TaxID=1610492 RepID=A0A239LCD7_9BACT|nr:ribose-5-phosphate isomerase RpiA [Pontibacter ummariensis]PRY03963.1 ribose-5-phosphate isomerase [Pontibacter ummariensis]SNT27194.1 ribose-5-phosphate isomerase [Pontibacter ummariensis]
MTVSIQTDSNSSRTLQQPDSTVPMEAKRLAAEKAVAHVESGMVVGLGTGSTASWAIKALGEKVRAGLEIRAVASSVASEQLAQEVGIPVTDFSAFSFIDVTIDGADEVDAGVNLIKGGGGALVREKILAYNSRHFIVVVDETKLVDTLGEFPLPVEIIPFAAELTLGQLSSLGCLTSIRQQDGKDFITDNSNLIADCNFPTITAPSSLHDRLARIPGVVESGLFLQPMVSRLIVGYQDGRIEDRLIE